MPPKTEKTVEKAPGAEPKAAEASKLSPARQRDLEAAISSITKAYGEGSIMRLGDARSLRQIEVIPTRSLAMDLALGVGGILAIPLTAALRVVMFRYVWVRPAGRELPETVHGR